MLYRQGLFPVCVEVLEIRQLFSGFPNWSAIQPAIGKVPAPAGQLASTKVVNFGTTVYSGPLSVVNTLSRIRADNGPDRSNDGAVYTNPQGSGLPVDGTYYEFTVEPSGGTDHNFGSSISFPGPMRILLATGGDCFFTGDHYSTFQAVYISGSATPSIGSFTDNPTTVTSGTPTTLTASNVTESGGTISSVKFYRESNGTSGLQTSADLLVGTGSASGSTWTISAATSGVSAGTYTYYAVATDSAGTTSSVASTTLNVTAAAPGAPTIGGFTASPTTVTAGTSVSLSASGVTETSGTISAVKFYRESNSTSGLQTTGDTLIGTGAQSGTTWSISTSTTGFAAGTYTYYAVATDASGASTTAAATESVTTGGGGGTPIPGVAEAWSVTGQTAFGTQGLKPGTVGSAVTNSLGLTRGGKVTTSGTAAANAWGGANFASTSSAGISNSEFVTFGLTVASGHSQSLSSINLNYRRSSTGPASGYWQYQLNGGAWALVGDFANEFSSTSSSGSSIPEISLNSLSALQNLAAGSIVNFRLTPYASTSTGGTWYVYDAAGNDLVINGSSTTTTAPVAAPSATPFSSKTITSTHLFSTDNLRTLDKEILNSTGREPAGQARVSGSLIVAPASRLCPRWSA